MRYDKNEGTPFLNEENLNDDSIERPARKMLSETESLCPTCLKKIPAHRMTDGRDIYLEKCCDDHGKFDTVLWRGHPSYETWSRPKLPVQPPVCYANISKGCPFDCGLCEDHRQISCTVLLEVTERCNLSCRYCFAEAGKVSAPDPSLDIVQFWFDRVKTAAPACNIQLSGGEPTVRNDLPQIIEMGRHSGFSFIQLNTNGLRLAREKGYAKELKAAGLASVFLQFDGVTNDVYRQLRGADLAAEKMGAISQCGEAGLGVVLVPMIVPGINDHQLGDILEVGIQASPTVRGIHFQPVSYFGRRPISPKNADRITLPEILAGLETQSCGKVRADDFSPPGCENALCSFHGRFFITKAGGLKPIVTLPLADAGSPPESADVGARRTISSVARQWGPVRENGVSNADSMGQARPSQLRLAGETASCCGSTHNVSFRDGSASIDIDSFLEMARRKSLSISAMAFQDVWNLDLERLRDCCIHVMSPDGRLIPFCAYNLTDSEHHPLYRTRL